MYAGKKHFRILPVYLPRKEQFVVQSNIFQRREFQNYDFLTKKFEKTKQHFYSSFNNLNKGIICVIREI
jgi:hypothetical protein